MYKQIFLISTLLLLALAGITRGQAAGNGFCGNAAYVKYM